VLVDPKWPITERFVSEVRAAALAVQQQVELLNVSTGRDIDTVFASLARKPVDALLVGPSPLANNRRVQIVTLDLLARNGAVCREVAVAMGKGALAIAGASRSCHHRRRGPEADEDGDPVGLVCVAVARHGHASFHAERHYGGPRPR
jgi:hypothetical protein